MVEGLVGHGDEAGGGRVGDQVAVQVQGAFGVLLRRGGEAGLDRVGEEGQGAGFMPLPRGGGWSVTAERSVLDILAP